MRNIVVVEYTSLDGVIQAPGHAGEDSDGGFEHGGWTGPFMYDHRRYLSETFQGAGAFLFGRLTYQIFAAYWPSVTDENDHQRPGHPDLRASPTRYARVSHPRAVTVSGWQAVCFDRDQGQADAIAQ
jgi:dihydrofolate reductase